jgi:hypothetical protein
MRFKLLLALMVVLCAHSSANAQGTVSFNDMSPTSPNAGQIASIGTLTVDSGWQATQIQVTAAPTSGSGSIPDPQKAAIANGKGPLINVRWGTFTLAGCDSTKSYNVTATVTYVNIQNPNVTKKIGVTATIIVK